MPLYNINPTTTQAWKKLSERYNQTKDSHMKAQFSNDANRASDFTIQWKDFLVDYSKNRIDRKTMQLLLQLTKEVNLKDAIGKYFGAEAINQTEGRAVLHTALRAKYSDTVMVNGVNVVDEVYEVKRRIKEFTDSVISGECKGYSGKSFTDVVNIGIGGSDLGPAMVTEALKYYKNHLNVHFVSRW